MTRYYRCIEADGTQGSSSVLLYGEGGQIGTNTMYGPTEFDSAAT